jgi:hypothetical protein
MRVLQGCPRCKADLDLGRDADDSMFGRVDSCSCRRCGCYLGGDDNIALVPRIAQLRSLDQLGGSVSRRPAA